MIGTNNNNMIIPSVEVTDMDDANNNNIPPPPLPLPPIDLESVVDDEPQIHHCSPSSHDNPNVLCLSTNTIDLFQIPISALDRKTLQRLSATLNPIKVILSEDGVQRDWRGVHHYLHLESLPFGYLQRPIDHMAELLKQWQKECDTASVGKLRQIIGDIDRWDVVDDTSEMFVEDARAYLKEQAKREVARRDSSEIISLNEAPQKHYDALILAADEDVHHVAKIIEVLESRGLEVCVKEHLLGGEFKHEAILKLISQYCERVVLVLSTAFIKSRAELFFASFAQAWGIEKCQRKVIPCMFGDISKEQLPISFQFYHVLRFDPERKYCNFWNQLELAVRSTPSMIINHTSMPKITVSEIDAPSPLQPALQQPPQPQKASIDPAMDSRTPQPIPRKRKDKSTTPKLQKATKASSKSSKTPKMSSPATPSTLKPFWPPSPKLRSQPTISSSMWTLSVGQAFDKENARSRSTLSLNSPDCSPASSLYKKPKWYKKLLSPNTGSAYKLSADSDSSMGMEKSKKKKSWYRKRFRSKNRDLAKEV